MTEQHKRNMTLAGVASGLVLLGGLVATSVDWAIKTSERIGENSVASAHRDSLFNARLTRVEKRLGLKPGDLKVQVKQEGVFKRIVRLFW